MAKKVYEEEKIRAIAERIREVTEEDTEYTTLEMPKGIVKVYAKGYDNGYAKCTEDMQDDLQAKYDEGYADGAASGGGAQSQAVDGLLYSFDYLERTGKITYYSGGIIYANHQYFEEFKGHLIIPKSYYSMGMYEMPITALGQYAFEGCYYLEKVTIPNSIILIDAGAFGYCSALAEIVFDGTVAEWEAIEKISGWNYHISATEVKCTDGTVAL